MLLGITNQRPYLLPRRGLAPTIRITKRAVDAIGATNPDTIYWDEHLSGFGSPLHACGKTYVVQYGVAGLGRRDFD